MYETIKAGENIIYIYAFLYMFGKTYHICIITIILEDILPICDILL